MPSIVLLVVSSSMASHEFTWRGTLANTVVLLAISMVAFVWGVRLQLTLWPDVLGA